VQGFPPPRPRPLGPSPLVPVQQTPPGADGARTEAAPAHERPTVPAPRPEPADAARPGLPIVRSRAAQPDAVVFTAPCPACGADCDWTEQREDTRLRAVVSCPCA
jgi:hypothetical protein